MSNQKTSKQTGSLKKNTLVDNTRLVAQRRRLLARLLLGPVDTFVARRELNILHPAGSIDELRRQGYAISTQRITLTDDQGNSHVGIALYILHSGSLARGAA
jgi:hypothetical protein